LCVGGESLGDVACDFDEGARWAVGVGDGLQDDFDGDVGAVAVAVHGGEGERGLFALHERFERGS